MLLVAVGDFSHYNLRETVSEHLVLPLALLLFLLGQTRALGASALVRLPWWGLYAGVLGMQCTRILGEVLPH